VSEKKQHFRSIVVLKPQ